MSKRVPSSRSPNECGLPSQCRKSTKKNNLINDSWHNYDRDRDNFDASDDEYSGMDYSQILHQQSRLHQPQPHPPHNGQRLFTAMSDPGVCGYPQPLPIPYALEPVSLPPMYHQYYQPVVRLNYRPYRTRPRTSSRHLQSGPPNSNDIAGNGYSSLQENGWGRSPMSYQNGDYASLPPTANLDNPDIQEELSSEHRRYSDPGLGPADSTNLKNEDTDTESSSITNIERSNRLFMTLVDQMTRIKETNSQLFKELHQAKSELETVKTELYHFKQNVPPDYQPGMLTDIIKEIRDANKIKEEAMLSKVKSLLESQPTQRLIDLEELKIRLEKVKKGKEESEERIDKLEKEVAELRLRLNSENHREIAAFEEENLALRRELQEARASKSHAKKCVDDETDSSYGDIGFESLYNSPCITSTPVRTKTTTTTTINTIDPSPSIVVVEDFRCSTASPTSSLDSLPLQLINEEETINLADDDDKSNNTPKIKIRPASVESNEDSTKILPTSSVPATNFSRTTYTAYI